ncbi:MAG: hypothetical protein HY791_12665 [Deltaproteobacteria bacterium]|nr:hypothetical protein [Deltaproteobacteria bacterium]
MLHSLTAPLGLAGKIRSVLHFANSNVRRSIGLTLVLVSVGCPRAEEPAKPEEELPPVEEPKEPPPPVITPKSLALKAAETVSYRYSESYRRDLAGKEIASHKVEVDYSATAAPRAGGSTVLLSVATARASGKREDVSFTLDSAKDMKKLSSGAVSGPDLAVLVPFALVGAKVEVDLDERGAAVAVRGGDAVRANALKMLPAKARTTAATELTRQASDDALALRLLPSSAYLPKDGDLLPGRRVDVGEAPVEGPDYAGRGATAVMLSDEESLELRVRVRRIESPLPDKSATGPIIFVDGTMELSADFDRASPLFGSAKSDQRRQLTYEGILDAERGSFPVSEQWQRVWSKNAAP